MYFRLILALALLTFCAELSAQTNVTISQTEKDYLKYQEILKEVIKKSETDTANYSEKHILHPVHLPDWFFYFPKSGEQTIYSIGISDPGMDESSGLALAELRAKSITALLLQPICKSITDYFSDEKSKSNNKEFNIKYINYFNISSTLYSDKEHFNSVASFFTPFNEAIVLLKYTIPESFFVSIDTIIVSIDAYQAERQKFNKFEMDEKYVITGTLQNDSTFSGFSYSFLAINNLIEITSEFNEKEIKFPYINFKYQGQTQQESLDFDNSAGNKLNYGLWKSFVEALLQGIVIMSQTGPVSVKQVGDNSQTKNQNISREISETTLSFKINCIKINNNRISLSMGYLGKN